MKAPRVCSTPGCPALVPAGTSRCSEHRRESSSQRGYTGKGHARFRRAVLRRDPVCVLCGAPATVADHWPVSRRDLQARGLDPDDPSRGRGLCMWCHNRSTAELQPGGWNN